MPEVGETPACSWERALKILLEFFESVKRPSL